MITNNWRIIAPILMVTTGLIIQGVLGWALVIMGVGIYADYLMSLKKIKSKEKKEVDKDDEKKHAN